MDLLVNAVGPGNAKDLLFTARVVNAGEAMRMGLVNQVLPKDELDAHCDRVAESIARGLAPMTIAADTVIVCAGQEPRNELMAALAAAEMPVHTIGGALKAGELDAERAIREGVELGLKL